MKLNPNFSLILFIGMLLLPSGQGLAQTSPTWNKPALRDSVTALLSRYQILQNRLNGLADASLQGDFIHLFSNPKVQLVNDLSEGTGEAKISVEEYVGLLIEKFPDGLSVQLNMSRMTLDQPRYDRNNRYVMRVNVGIETSGVTGGRVFTRSGRTVFLIAFYYQNNTAVNFAIHGTDLPPKAQFFLDLGASFGPSLFSNREINLDERLSLESGNGYSLSARTTCFLNRNVGVGAGFQYAAYSGNITLDRFDALGLFNPNLEEVSVGNKLWIAEIPVEVSFRTNPARKFECRADAGLSFGFLVYGEMSSTATNTFNGRMRSNVISDNDWFEQMHILNVSMQARITLHYHLNPWTGVYAGMGIKRGLTGLDRYERTDFAGTRYQGQYNPLWAAPGSTVANSLYLSVGTSIRLNREKMN